MTTISDKDYRDILDTVYAVNCCEDEESFLDILMPSMINMFHADCVTFHLIQGYPFRIKVVESRSFKTSEHNLNEDKVYPHLYTDNYYQQSPLLKKAMASSKTVLKIGESISVKDWERSVLYNHFIAPQNLYWEMFLTLRWKDKLEGMITIWRAKEQGNYAESDTLKAGMLAPHLMVATRKVSSFNKINAHPLTIEESNAEGLLLLDHNLKLLYFNDRAHQICLQMNNQYQQSIIRHEGEEFAIPDYVRHDCSQLLDSMKAKRQPISWPRERVIVTQNNQRFRLECSVIWKAAAVGFQPNFMVIMGEIHGNRDSIADIQSKYNLSKREMDIIYYLNKGLSYSDIGEKLFISKLTVHTHIKNIYRKLGTRSRLEFYHCMQP